MTSDELRKIANNEEGVSWYGASGAVCEALNDAADELDRLTARVAELEKPQDQWAVIDERDGYLVGVCPLCASEHVVGDAR